MRNKGIAITGMGMISALGHSPAETWEAILAEKSGLTPLTVVPSRSCANFLVGEVKGDVPSISGLARGSRSDHLATFAAREAFRQGGLQNLSEEERKKIGIVLGANTGGILETEQFLKEILRGDPGDLNQVKYHKVSSSTRAIGKTLGIGGFRSTVSTACSSGCMALSVACDAIEMGEGDIMLAGGVDSLTRLTLNGFSSLLIVSPEGCRPFDARRDGMNLGEGAGILVLESLESAQKRGAKIQGLILGRASTCDAFHMSAPNSEGSGIFRAMSLALKNAALEPRDIDYINAHGTGTLDNDRAEGKAIEQLFGKDIPLVSSTKRFFGHTLGAAGALETIVCVLALQEGRVPANLGLDQRDPEINFQPLRKTTAGALKVALNNSIGFGGNNCSLVISGFAAETEKEK